MKNFAKVNSEIDATMKTHYIDDLDQFGIWTDDYERFIELRAEKILDEINRRLLI